MHAKYDSRARGSNVATGSPLRLKRDASSIYYETILPRDADPRRESPLKPKPELRGIFGPAD